MATQRCALVLHGGAGSAAAAPPDRAEIERIHGVGVAMLRHGASAVDVVTECVRLLEDAPGFNAGRGSVLNRVGEVEMDAAIMDGRTLEAGAVALVRTAKNPILVARMVMEVTGHVLIAGPDVDAFAAMHGATIAPADYFRTTAQLDQWKQDRARTDAPGGDQHFGTVGAVACDAEGDVAAATSTGGVLNKLPGRIGDTPLVGAGVYADNRSCAVAVTGVGEHAIRTALARVVADLVEHRGLAAQTAADAGVAYVVDRVKGQVGMIVVDKNGRTGIARSTPAMTSVSAEFELS